jgi:hypothetical protein
MVPAAASVGLSIALLLLMAFQIGLHGGALGLGLYVLALQCAVAILGVVAIDDLTRGAGWASRPQAGRHHGWFEIGTRPVGFPTALALFYSRPLVPVLLLALGTGLPFSAVIIGALGKHRLDLAGLAASRLWVVVVALSLIGTALLLWRGTSRAALGLVCGLTLSSMLGERTFSPYVGDVAEVRTWLASAGVLSGAAVVVGLLRRLRARSMPTTGSGLPRTPARTPRP